MNWGNMISLPEAVIGGLTLDILIDKTDICLKFLWPPSFLSVASGRLLTAKVYLLKAFNKYSLYSLSLV